MGEAKESYTMLDSRNITQPSEIDKQVPNACSWSYIHVHYKMVDKIQDDCHHYKDAPAQCFVHRTVTSATKIKKKRPQVVSMTRQTISGLIFFQGCPQDIQLYLSAHYDHLYLVKDPATEKPAVIPNSQMVPFMKMDNYDPSAVRIMDHPISYYAEGHKLMRMLTGILKGHEGYVVRKNGDRKFFMPFGTKSIAISNVHKEQFEEV